MRPDQPLRWRARPLLLAAGCLATGILAARASGVEAGVWSLMLIAIATIALLALVVRRRRLVTLRRLTLTLLAGLAFASLGGQRYAMWSTSIDAPLTWLAIEADAHPHAFPVVLSGRVMEAPSVTDRRLQFSLAVDSAGYMELRPTSGRASVTLWRGRQPGDPPLAVPDLHPGHRVAVTGLLRPLPERRNPADFDYGAYLQRRGFHAVVSSSDSGAVVVRGYEPTVLERWLATARGHVRAALTAHVRQPGSRAVLEALLLADRSGIDPEVRTSFARTGLAHLLAVSGLHVFLVGMVLYGLLKPLLHRLGWGWRRVEVVRATLTLALLAIYVSVVGGPPSAARALVMAAALIGGRAIERPSNSLNSLGAAALVLLIVRPAALFDVGFQLSFAAVGGIVLLIPVLQSPIPTRWRHQAIARYPIGLLLASVAATLGTMPVLLAHFGVVPLGGVLLNLAAIPLTAGALGGGLLTVAFHGWAAPLASMAGTTADVCAGWLLGTGEMGVRWLGWTAIDLFVTSLVALLAIVMALVAIALWSRPRLRWRCTAAALAMATLTAWQPLFKGDRQPVLELLFFDVGQGDAVLMTLPNGRRLLIDAGPADPYGDAGARTIIPHLARHSIRSLDAVVVSHPHADHLGGVPSLLEAVRVQRVMDNGEDFDSETFRLTRARKAASGLPRHSLRAGDTLDLDPAVTIRVLHPGPEPDAHTNDASVVMHVTFGSITILLAGDVEAAAEATLTARYGEALCASAVKVPHHGSRTSSTAPFVRAVTDCGDTQFAVVQVARRNRYQHPSEEALARWRNAGAEILKTSRDGAIWLRTDGQSIWRERWR
jgi:competence protein ComEC